jgi:hypothetical protein
MRWRDLDLEAAFVADPLEFCKNGRAHRLPFVRDTITIIKAQRKNMDQQQKDSKQDRQDKLESWSHA